MVDEKLQKSEQMFAENFDKRYGKATIVRVAKAEKDTTSLVISCDGDNYEITEYRKEGLTDKVIVKYGDREYLYKKYLDAEVHIADIIGEKRWDLQKATSSELRKQ